MSQSTDALVASAKELLAKDETSAAVIQLRSAIQQEPEAAEARFVFGKVLLQGGDPAGAAVELRKALALKFSEDEVVPELARAMLAQGLSKEVIEEFSATKSGTPASSGDLQTSLARAYAARGMMAESETALQAALAARPDHAAAQVLQAQLLSRQGDISGALALVAKVIEKHREDSGAWKTQGDLLLHAKGDLSGAFESFRKAITFDKSNLDAHAGAVSILLKRADDAAVEKQLAEMRKVAPSHPQTRYFDAQLAYRRRDFTRTRTLVQDLLRTFPDDARVLQLAGGTELELGALAQAEAHLRKAMQFTGNEPMTRQLLAQTYIGAGQPEKATDILKPILEREPDATTLSLAAQARVMSGDAKAGEKLYARAAKLDPRDIRNRIALALMAIGQGKLQSGFQELETLASTDKGTTADVALITARLARKEFAAALKAADALEVKSTDKAFSAGLRGRVLLLSGDAKAARQSFERALSIQPELLSAASGLASIDVLEKNPAAARKRFEAVLQADPKSVQAMLALADLVSRTGASKDEVAKLLEAAVKVNPTDSAARARLVDHHLRTKEPRLALIAAQNGLATAPNSPEMLDLTGRAQMAASEYEQAVGTFGRLVALPPETAQAHLHLAEAQLAVKSAGPARLSLKRALVLAPDLLPAQQKLIALELAEGRPQEAAALVRTVQTQRPKQVFGYVLEGDLESARKNPAAAVAAYRTALRITPGTDIAIRLHTALAAAAKPAEAQRFASDWLKDHARDAVFLFHLGDAASAQGEYAQSQGRYREVLKLTPDNYLALNNLAWVMTLQGKPGATEFAQRAFELRPNQPAIMGTLASALAQDGQYERAIEMQRKAVELQPQMPVFRLNLARIYVKADRKAQAEAELGELAKLGDKFPGQADVAQLLKTIKGG